MKVYDNGVATLYQADARDLPIPDASVHCVVTSPPYWGLRDYGLGDWAGGDEQCDHKKPNPSDGKWDSFRDSSYLDNATFAWPANTCGRCGAVKQPAGIGLEPTLAEHIENIVDVGRELWRVMRDDAVWFLNYGDAYATSGTRGYEGGTLGTRDGRETGYRAKPTDFKAKDLMMMPHRIAIALQDDGWYVRSAIVWAKPNPMPESVRDRPTNAYEMIFLLTKKPRYFWDAEAIRTAYSPVTPIGGVYNGQAQLP